MADLTNLGVLRCLLDQLVIFFFEHVAFLLLHAEQFMQVHPFQVDRLSIRVALVADRFGDGLRQVSESSGFVRRHQGVRDHDAAVLRGGIEFGFHFVARLVAFRLVETVRGWDREKLAEWCSAVRWQTDLEAVSKTTKLESIFFNKICGLFYNSQIGNAEFEIVI